MLATYDFSSFSVLMDVGGGTGEMIGSVLAATPGLRGILFDLPHVVAHASEVLERFGVADRCECAPGSFFESVPTGADVLMIKQVVHDWDDDQAVALLSRCRESMRPGAKLLIIERVMPERVQAEPRPSHFYSTWRCCSAPAAGREREASSKGACGCGTSTRGNSRDGIARVADRGRTPRGMIRHMGGIRQYKARRANKQRARDRLLSDCVTP